MKLKMSLMNVESEFKKLFDQRQKLTKEQALTTVNTLKEELIQKTPIDTGLARASWKINESKDNYNLENTTEYIQYLNQGSSQQAPAYFIESTAIKYGVPIGTIVEIKDN